MITIPTFEQFIEEGLWSAGMKRVEKDDKRQEDKIPKHVLLNMFNDKVYNFFKEHEFVDEYTNYRYAVTGTYSKFVKDYANAHGTLQLGFTPDDEAPMPDFEIKLHIDDFYIQVTYNDQYKEFKVSYDDVDLSETEVGKHLYNTFCTWAFVKLSDESDILRKNIKRNIKYLLEHLYEDAYKIYYDNIIYDVKNDYSLDDISVIPLDDMLTSKDYNIWKFFIKEIKIGTFDDDDVVEVGHKNIANTHEGKRIIATLQEAYNDALEKATK